MAVTLNRRQLPALLAAAPLAAAATGNSKTWAGFPQQDFAWVKEVVGAAHSDIGRVKAVVEAHPAAANATMDWGFGDWETPLGAAAHTGRREIAEYLLEKGARLDLFAATMLGMTDVVKAMVAARPGVESTPGPHGIPLIVHARAGGAKAKETLEYLQTLPGAAKAIVPAPLDEARRKTFAGFYQIDGGPKAEVRLSSPTQLSIIVDNASSRFLHYLGNDAFYPAGAPGVRIEFQVKEQVPQVMRIVDGPETFVANRVS